MTIETGTYVDDLDATLPAANDIASQGDDHVRLIKSFLKATFTNATHAYRFPETSAKSADFNVVAADHNKLFLVDTSAEEINVGLVAVASAWPGFRVGFKMVAGSNNLVLDGDGAELIEGNATLTISIIDDVVWLMADATEWHITEKGTVKEIPAGTTFEAGAITAAALASSTMGSSMINGTLVPSVGSNALTIAVKTLAGTDPTAADPVYMLFRSNDLTIGSYVIRTITSALSLTINSGATLGTSDGVAFRTWIIAIDTGSTVRLGISNRRVTGGISPFPLHEVSATLISSGADSSDVVYAAASISSNVFIPLGYMNWRS